ncbi:hypothetical protein CBR_g53791 [Chara braunii]|uniref:Uncharacterized protein n=1 Tax=Chara braunii TaxID=69332 RepID=A0A388K6Z1_CHABU|nr:hypothetical protein CBR_g53791 [Chara braunii]|eukprot:GBG65820.1 hypothetical protein CBR_g53791 [Chara braunii]
MVDTHTRTSTSTYTAEQEAKAAAILKERREKEAKKKALLEELAAKKKKIEEKMVREMERLQKEEEKLQAVEAEEEVEEKPLERRRTRERAGPRGAKEDPLEKKITKWVANLSLGEEEAASIYVTREEQEASMKEWDAEEDRRSHAQVSDLHKKISWDDMTKEWKKRFIVNDAPALTINRLFATTQGNTPTRDCLTEWQKFVATPDLELPFSHLRREFYNQSCGTLSLELGDREQYTTFAEIIHKAREIIKTNRAAAQEKSAWQPTHVEKGKLGPCPQPVAAAATPASRGGDQVAAVQPRSNNNSRGKEKAKIASPAGNGQPYHGSSST